MGRKFTESEVRAYSKNRHEEKILQTRLRKLREETGNYQEGAQKQIIEMVHESKGIRMTSGKSPVPAAWEMKDEDFEIFHRMKRPWAYSPMETTYNAVYQELQVPLPKPAKKRWRSKSVSALSRSTKSSLFRRSSEYETTDHNNSFMTKREISAETWSPSKYAPDVQTPVNGTGTTSNKFSMKTKDLNGNLRVNEKVSGSEEQVSRRKSVNNTSFTPGQDAKLVQITGIDIDHQGQRTVPEIASEEKLVQQVSSNNSLTLPQIHDKLNVCTDVLTDDQDNKPRTKSRVSFSSTSPLDVIFEDNARDLTTGNVPRLELSNDDVPTTQLQINGTKTPVSENLKPADSPTSKVFDVTPNRLLERQITDVVNPAMHIADAAKGHATQRPHTVAAMDTSAFVFDDEEETDDGNYTVYKGHKLRNYIRPQERYKLDPVIVKRRQLKMDRLAKESMTYLTRVNHENIRVEIAFPRSSRKRLLDQLVLENNSGRGRVNFETDGAYLKSRIEEFMDSIARYCEESKQQ